MSPRKVIIGQPVNKPTPPQAGISFARFLTISTMNGLVCACYQSATNPLGRARNSIVQEALKTDATHLCFVDSDMIIHPGALTGLLNRNVDVVSALYFTRTPPHTPVVFHDGTKPHEPWIGYKPGLSKVWVIGMGFALVRLDVFRRMSQKYGDEKWFTFDNDEGEDVNFCRRCHEMAIPVFLDANVKCGHVAEVVIGEEHFRWHQQGQSFAI